MSCVFGLQKMEEAGRSSQKGLFGVCFVLGLSEAQMLLALLRCILQSWSVRGTINRRFRFPK